MEKIPLINCQNLIFSPRLSKNRTDQAQQTLGSVVVQRILCFGLYLLGLNRRAIGQSLNIPSETAKSIIKAVNKDGLGALEDRRRRFSTFLPKTRPDPLPITLIEEEDHIVLDFGVSGRYLKLSRQDYNNVLAMIHTASWFWGGTTEDCEDLDAVLRVVRLSAVKVGCDKAKEAEGEKAHYQRLAGG